MRFFISLLSLVLFTVKSYSQITGRVIDESQNPIPFTNVLLIENESKKTIKGTLTDIDGNYIINNTPDANYFIKVSLIGYTEYTSEVFQINQTPLGKQIDDITLKIEVTSLNAVAVVSHKKLIEQTQEGSIINVQESVLTKGSSVLQLLERSPGVILDRRNNNFTLNGKSGTSIMLNGKLVRMPTSDLITMLDGMSADTIEKIELLTNPSSKYDADGNAGIINIVSTKNENLGTLGSISSSIGFGTGVKQNTSASINHSNEKITLFGNHSFTYDDTFSKWRGIGTTELPVFGGLTTIDFSSETGQINRSHTIASGLDLKMNKTSSAGFNVLLNFANPTINTNNRGAYNFASDPFLETRINLTSSRNLKNYNSSAYYELKGKKSIFNISGDLINYNNKSPNKVNSEYFDQNGISFQPANEIYNTGNVGINTTDIKIGVLKVDYANSINDLLTLEAGAKTTLSKTKNISEIKIIKGEQLVTDERFVNNNEIDEKIGAVYAIGKYKINEKTNIELGLRYEYWDRSFKNSDLGSNFGKLFPTFFLTKKLSDTTSFNLAYSRRITRPSFNNLAASLTYNSPTSVFSGNPFLLPAISNSLNLSYYFKSCSVSLIFSNEENPLTRFQVEENPISDLAVIAPQNLKYQNSVDLQTNIPIKISNNWRLNFNGTIGWRQFRITHTPIPVTHNYVHFNFNGNQTIQLPNQLSLELSGWYTSNHFHGSHDVVGFGTLNLGLKKQFKNHSSLQLSVSDIFSTFQINSQIGTLTQEAYNNVFGVEYYSESGISPIFKINYSKSFGNNKVKKTKVHSGSKDEKSRIN